MKKRLIFETIFILCLILISVYLVTLVMSATLQSAPTTVPVNGTYLQLTNTTEYINCTFRTNNSDATYRNITFKNATLYVANISGTITTANYNLTYNASNGTDTSKLYAMDGFAVNGTNNNSIAVTWKINETFVIPGMYIYNCRVTSDNLSATTIPQYESNWSTNKTIVMDGHTPNVTTVLPVNSTGLTPNINWSDETVTFSVTAMDENLANCTLYHNFNGTWERNETVTVDNNANTEVASFTLATNTTGMIWTIACDDYAGFRSTNFSGGGAASNYTIKVDAGAPGLTLTPAADKTIPQGSKETLKCAQSDAIGVGTVTLTVGGTTQICDEGPQKGTCTTSYIAGTSGTFTVKCTGADVVGNAAPSKSIALTVDTGVGGAGAGAGPSGGYNPPEPTQEITEEVTGIRAGTGQPFDIIVDGESYTTEVVAVTATTATISTGTTTNDYAIGDSKEVDLNGDGENDIEVTLDDISLGKALFTIKEVEVSVLGEAGVGEEETEGVTAAVKKPGVILGIIIAIIVILAGLYYFTRKK